jgi:hypothetical protein
MFVVVRTLAPADVGHGSRLASLETPTTAPSSSLTVGLEANAVNQI